MRRCRLAFVSAHLAAWSLIALAGGCGPSATEEPAVQQQNIDDELKAMENAKKGGGGI